MEIKTRKDKIEFIILVAILIFIIAMLVHGLMTSGIGRYEALAG